MPAPDDRHDTEFSRLQRLVGFLAAAKDLVEQLVHDPLTERLLRAFERLPACDREAILRIIERDAAWCRIVEQTSDTTGIRVVPNPHASLYLHVFGAVEDVEPTPLRRDVEAIRVGIERFVHMLPLFFQEGVHEQWRTSAEELVREAGPELRAHAARLAREVLDLVTVADAVADGAAAACTTT